MARSFQSNDVHEGIHESSLERTETLKAQVKETVSQSISVTGENNNDAAESQRPLQPPSSVTHRQRHCLTHSGQVAQPPLLLPPP